MLTVKDASKYAIEKDHRHSNIKHFMALRTVELEGQAHYPLSLPLELSRQSLERAQLSAQI